MGDGNGNGDRRAPLGWDLRTVVFLAVVFVWMVSVLNSTVTNTEVPSYVHGAMLAVVGYFVSDRLKRE